MRSAIGQVGWLAVVTLLVLMWAILSALDVAGTMQAYASTGGQYVGQSFVGGAMGVLVLLGFALSVLFLYSEMAEAEPVPESFPPR